MLCFFSPLLLLLLLSFFFFLASSPSPSSTSGCRSGQSQKQRFSSDFTLNQLGESQRERQRQRRRRRQKQQQQREGFVSLPPPKSTKSYQEEKKGGVSELRERGREREEGDAEEFPRIFFFSLPPIPTFFSSSLSIFFPPSAPTPIAPLLPHLILTFKSWRRGSGDRGQGWTSSRG